MLYQISNEAFLTYARRLSTHIRQAKTFAQLSKLQPSVEFLSHQSTTQTRTWTALTVLQDYNFKTTCLGGCYANSTRLS